MNRDRAHFLAKSALDYCFRIQCMARLAGETPSNPDFAARTARDIAQEAAKLCDDLEELEKFLATDDPAGTDKALRLSSPSA